QQTRRVRGARGGLRLEQGRQRGGRDGAAGVLEGGAAADAAERMGGEDALDGVGGEGVAEALRLDQDGASGGEGEREADGEAGAAAGGGGNLDSAAEALDGTRHDVQ